MHLKLKSHKVSLISCLIILKFGTEHDRIANMLFINSHNNLLNEMDILDKQDSI